MSIKLNYTNFTHGSMAIKVTAAMAHCLKTGEAVRVTNRRGAEFLLVTILRDNLGYRFAFHSMYDHEEVGSAIFRAIHNWSEPSHSAFWQLSSLCYELTEHPFVTISRNKSLDECQEVLTGSTERAIPGTTHRFTTVNGTVYYGVIKRDWRFRRYVLIVGAYGDLVKPTPEFLACIIKQEAL